MRYSPMPCDAYTRRASAASAGRSTLAISSMPRPSRVSERRELLSRSFSLNSRKRSARTRARSHSSGVGIEHDLAAERIDDQLVAFAHAIGDARDADHGRNLQRARQDRRMAGRAAEPRDQRRDRRLDQLRGIGRVQVGDHQHRVVEVRRQRRDVPGELRDDAPADVLDVDRAVAQVVDRRLRQVMRDLR